MKKNSLTPFAFFFMLKAHVSNFREKKIEKKSKEHLKNKGEESSRSKKFIKQVLRTTLENRKDKKKKFIFRIICKRA